jgi:hypothetical protein
MTTKAQELVDYLNARIARTGYNERQVLPNRVNFSVMPGKVKSRIVISSPDGSHRSSYAFVDAEGNIYKAAGWSASAKGVRSTVSSVLLNEVPFFNAVRGGFDDVAYSTSWLYAS